MPQDILDIYTDYLICQNQHATAVGLSDLLEGRLSHDQITRFLNRHEYSSKDLWQYVKSDVRRHEHTTGGVLIIDDAIEEKPYNESFNCFFRGRKKKRSVSQSQIVKFQRWRKKNSPA